MSPRLSLSGLLDGLGYVLLVAGAAEALTSLHGISAATDVASVYDEGLLLTGARAVLHGAVPHRDFYANYPPGVFSLLAFAWSLAGMSVATLHAVAALARVGLALLVCRLTGLACGTAFRPLAGGLLLAYLAPMGSASLAWIVALASALLTLWVVTQPQRGLGAWAAEGTREMGLARSFVAGAAFGLIGVFRHDLFVYTGVALGTLLFWARGRVSASRRDASLFAVASLAVLLPVWLPVLIRAGVGQVLSDLVFEQVAFVEPARSMPWPRPFALAPAPPFGALPAILVLPGTSAFALSAVIPVLGLALAWRRRDRHPQAAAWAGLSVLGIALWPHMVGRADDVHSVLNVAPALALAVAGVHRGVARGGGRAIASLAGVVLLLLPLREQLPKLGLPQALPAFDRPWSGSRPSAARERAVEAVNQFCPAGGSIFVGNTQHQRLIFNDAGFYYYAGRDAATRRTQFDPNVVTRAEVQQQMIAELERARPCAVVLFDAPWWPEPNLSAVSGSAQLDQYLAGRYLVVSEAPPWVVLRPATAVR